jgi:hypothetical protein
LELKSVTTFTGRNVDSAYSLPDLEENSLETSTVSLKYSYFEGDSIRTFLKCFKSLRCFEYEQDTSRYDFLYNTALDLHTIHDALDRHKSSLEDLKITLVWTEQGKNEVCWDCHPIVSLAKFERLSTLDIDVDLLIGLESDSKQHDGKLLHYYKGEEFVDLDQRLPILLEHLTIRGCSTAILLCVPNLLQHSTLISIELVSRPGFPREHHDEEARKIELEASDQGVELTRYYPEEDVCCAEEDGPDSFFGELNSN